MEESEKFSSDKSLLADDNTSATEALASMLFELSSSKRLALVFLLKDRILKLSQLSNLLEISATETSRHLARLEEEYLVEKGSLGQYNLTNLGRLVTQKLPTLELLSHHRRFFVLHDFTVLPDELLSHIDVLCKADLVQGVGMVMSTREEILAGSEKSVTVLVDQQFPSLFPVFTEKLKSGIKFDVIVKLEVLKGQKGCNNPNVREHVIDELPIALMMNETKACINFPDKTGKIDYSEGFCGDSIEFIDWCDDIFRYYWKVSKTLTLET
ncbi:MAG: helix-turn-helix transcriptional regulator [Nitrososphaerales archaeon]